MDGFFAVNNLDNIMTISRNYAHLIDLLWVLLCFHLDRQHRGFDDASLQASLPTAHCLHRVNKDVTSLSLMLVLGESWASSEFRGVFFVGRFCFSERFPGISQLLEDLLLHLRRKYFVRFMWLHALINLF